MTRKPLMPHTPRKAWPFLGAVLTVIFAPLAFYLVFDNWNADHILGYTVLGFTSALAWFIAAIFEHTFVRDYLPERQRFRIGFPAAIIISTVYCWTLTEILI